MARIVFIQCQVSQVDEPVYARMHQIDPDSVAVLYWNDYGLSRRHADPETGVVPDFSETMTDYPREWLDSRSRTSNDVVAAVRALKPALAVISDIPNRQRVKIATALRWSRIEVALRVDKNRYSRTANSGLRLAAERGLVRSAYDMLAPVSPLTNLYYAWPASRRSLLFPYTTNERKFSPAMDVREHARKEIRDRLGIGDDSFVFLSAAKFVERENPWAVVRCFERLAAERDNVFLIALGDGALHGEIREYCRTRGVRSVAFPGFVPFRELQDYFFAADAFLHLAAIEPWGISPQDALLAGLGLIVTDRVGSGQVFLDGELSRFVVPFGAEDAIVERMRELAARGGDGYERFLPARAKATDYTAEACARRWVAA